MTDDSKTRSIAQAMVPFHTWAGLLAGWILYLVFFTGTLTVFFQEISFWMQPERAHGPAISEIQAVRMADAFMRDHDLQSARLLIRLPNERRPDIRIGVQLPGQASTAFYLDPADGHIRQVRKTDGGYLFQALHWRLDIERQTTEAGVLIVGLATALFVALLVSGIFIHKKILKDIFVFRAHASYQRSWLDSHNLSSVLALPFLFFIAYTGLVLVYYIYMPAGISALYDGSEKAFRRDSVFINTVEGTGVPLARMRPFEEIAHRAIATFGEGKLDSIRVFPKKGRTDVEIWRTRHDRIGQQMDRLVFDAESGELIRTVIERQPAQRFQSFLAGLHLIEFGGREMQWLYFVMGLFGTASIATGLILFPIKRSRKAYLASVAKRRWLRLATRLNVGVIAGLFIASAAFLVSNRMIPTGLAGRADIEVYVFFATWAGAVLHAAARDHLRAWIEQLAIAAIVALSLPFVTALFEQRVPMSYALEGDWVRFWVEATTCIAGLCLAIVALKLRKVAAGRAASSGVVGGVSEAAV